MGKSSLKYIILSVSLFFLIIVLVWLFRFSSTLASDIISPIGGGNVVPTPVNTLFEKILISHTTENYPPNSYFPQNLDIEDTSGFYIDALSYIAVDRDSRKILLGKNITTRYPVASITKIATAIVSLENASLRDEFIVSPSASKIGEATMGLSKGEKIMMEDALYGLMLPSGNDAAETLAEGIGKYNLGTPQEEVDGGGARSWFIHKMNEKVQSLGMMDTYFFNPSGLDGKDVTHTNFSTALDIAAFTNYALNNPIFSKIASTYEMVIPYKEGFHKAFYLYNILRFDNSYPGIKGVKPGISDYALETLSSYNEKDGRRIIVVILGSMHTKDDVIKIYDRIFGATKS